MKEEIRSSCEAKRREDRITFKLQPDHPEYVQLTKKRAKCPFLLLIQSYQLCVYGGFRQILFVTKHQQYQGLSVRL